MILLLREFLRKSQMKSETTMTLCTIARTEREGKSDMSMSDLKILLIVNVLLSSLIEFSSWLMRWRRWSLNILCIWVVHRVQRMMRRGADKREEHFNVKTFISALFWYHWPQKALFILSDRSIFVNLSWKFLLKFKQQIVLKFTVDIDLSFRLFVFV